MKLVKPEWMHHDGDQILSLDIDPTGMRIATAGRGEASGKICIWDMGSVKKIIIDGGSFEKYASRAKLSELEEHTGCVNCVRWSKNGQLLASGGDDCNIIIWCIKKMQTYTNDKSLKNREMWKSMHTLQGHTGDILDIAWSNCGKFLASASIDNLIVIWDVKNFPNMIRKLVGHQSFVKGLAWDPVGEFLASQSDDKTLMIWSTLNFVGDNTNTISPTAVIKKPFQKATSLTQFLRLAWSTDGQFIISAHAANNTAPVAKIIERGSWNSNKDCVGHRAAISSVAFNPNIYRKNNNTSHNNSQNDDISVVCALGSRDGTLSLWKFPQKRPFIVIHNLFISAIADMSWNTMGNILLVSSVEGNLSFITFEPTKDFGQYPLKSNEIIDYHKKHYGLNIQTAYQIPNIPMSADFVLNDTPTTNNPNKGVVNAVNNTIENTTKITQENNTINHPASTTNTTIEEVDDDSPQQKETILKDGRKRITPILIAAPIDDSPATAITYNDDRNTSVLSKKFKKKVVHFEDGGDLPSVVSDKSNRTTSMVNIRQRCSNENSFDANTVIGVFSRRSVGTSTKVKTPPVANFHEFTVEIDKVLFNVSVKNESANQKTKTYELRCVKNNQPCWSCFLMGRVVFIKHCEKMIVCTTEDNRLHAFNYSGWRIFPQIIISDTIIGLFVSAERYISVVTTFGQILVWDVTSQKALHQNIYIPMDQLKDNTFSCVKSVDIHPETEQPIVILNDYTTYLYNNQLAAWLPLTDKLCCFAGCFPSLASGLISIIDGTPFSNVQKFYEVNNCVTDQYSDNSIVGCTSFLLNQLDVFITLKLKQAFYDTFVILIQFLTEHNKEQTIASLCEHLTNTTMSRNDIIFNNVGYSGVCLMEKLLQIIKTNIKMQKIYLKFQSLL